MFVHGNNLEQKENHQTKYRDADSRRYLIEIRKRYDEWKTANEILKGPVSAKSENDLEIIFERVRLLNEYKNFLDQQHYAEKFDSRSNLHSSVLEEFLYFLFRDMVFGISESALIGKSHSFKDVFFRAPSYQKMVEKSHALVEIKDHDFAIGVSIKATIQCLQLQLNAKHILTKQCCKMFPLPQISSNRKIQMQCILLWQSG
jgi:Bpu10I restriction endonuclease